jgi:hypothetical protein
MNYENFDTKEIDRILASNGIDLESLELKILSLVHGESFKNEDALKIHFSEWDEPYPFIDPYKGAIEPALAHCLKNGWIKKIKQDDVFFEKQFYNNQIINTFTPYRLGYLGLSYAGAQLYNKAKLLVDELYKRRPYETIIDNIYQENKIILYSCYEDILLKALPEKMHNLYWHNYYRGNKLDITYFTPYKINSWCIRRFITLETGYGAEIHY